MSLTLQVGSSDLSNRRASAVHAVLLTVAVVTSCGDDDADPAAAVRDATTTTEAPSSSSEPGGGQGVAGSAPTPAPTASTATSKSTKPSPSTAPQQTTTGGGGTSAAGGEAEKMTFQALFARRHDLVGRRVEATGKAFFVSQCPPPGSSPSGCTLTGYLADPDRNDLLYGDRGEAIVLSENGALVSCEETTSTACPGWQHAQRYRIVATVERRVLGGKETQEVELEVSSKTPA